MNILYPVFILVLWTLLVAMRLGLMRWRAVRRRDVKIEYYEAYVGDGEPTGLRVLSRHLSNLLEVPPLFYVACLTAIVTSQTGALVVALAWAYTILRLAHSAVHLGANDVLWRFRVFALSMITLAALWLILLAGMLSQ